MKKSITKFLIGLIVINGFYSFGQGSWTQKANFTGTGRYVGCGFSIGHYGFIGCGSTASGYVSDFYRWNQTTNTWKQVTSYPGNGQYLCTSFAIGAKGYVGMGHAVSGNQTDFWSYDTGANSWTKMASFPGTAPNGAKAFVIGTNAYVLCGDPGAPPYLNDVWEYNSVKNTWTQKGNFPGSSGRAGMVAFAIGKNGYAGCGASSNTNSTNEKDMWQYDTATDSWTQIADLPVAGLGDDDASPFVIGTVGYVGTGADVNSNKLRLFWGYDTVTKAWSAIPSLTGVSRLTAVSFSVGNYGYIGTGLDSNSNYLTDFWEYSPSTKITCNVWTQKANFTGTGRYVGCGFSIGHYGFIGCGSTSSGYVSDFYRWNQTTNTWKQIASYPGNGQYLCTSFAIGAKGYVGMGHAVSGNQTDFWSYDTGANSWTKMASFPGTAPNGAKAFVIGTNAYVLCGDPGAPPYLNDVWEYNSVKNTWTQKGNFPGSSGRAGMVAFAIGKNGYAGCGASSNTNSTNEKDMWQYDTATDSWTQIADLPVTGLGDDDASAFVIGTVGYVGTGADVNSKKLHLFWGYDTVTKAWSAIPNLTGVGRLTAVSFSVGNYGYIGTGLDSNSNYLTDFWQYYPCSDTNIYTSVNTISPQLENIRIYPNPSSGLFKIEYSGLVSDRSDLQIVDMLGRILNTYSIFDKEGTIAIDEHYLTQGMYFYRVVSGNEIKSTGRIIISK